eukprot:2702334-Pyramimonas_sp.AAC.2
MAATGMFKDTKAGNPEYQLMATDEDGDNKYHGNKSGSDFKIGMAAAVYVGFANGSFMTPLKYANK